MWLRQTVRTRFRRQQAKQPVEDDAHPKWYRYTSLSKVMWCSEHSCMFRTAADKCY